MTHGLWLIQKFYAESLDIMVSNPILYIGELSYTFLPGSTNYDGDYYNTSIERIYNVVCTGSEVKLLDCVHSTGVDGSSEAIEMGCEWSK